MGEPRRQYQPIDLLEFKRRLLADAESSPEPDADRLAELARIVGGDGRIVSAEAEPRNEASKDGGTSGEAQPASLPKVDIEPLSSRPPYATGGGPPAGALAESGGSAHEERRRTVERAPYNNDDLFVAPAHSANLWPQRLKRANTSFYATAAAVVIAGILAGLFLRPGGSPLSPANRHENISPVAETPPAATKSAPAIVQNPSASAANPADAAGGAQLSSVPERAALTAIVASHAEATAAPPAAAPPPAAAAPPVTPPPVVASVPATAAPPAKIVDPKIADPVPAMPEPAVQAPQPFDISADEQQQMLLRAATMLGQGDITGARMILVHLDRIGNGQASFGLAQTYDPIMLNRWNVLGIKPDADKAQQFYKRALDEGIDEAKDHLIASVSPQQ